tara:strand:- start:464 stop:685 length:222 start_codon:yes stop_codon:yes gene_type:complete
MDGKEKLMENKMKVGDLVRFSKNNMYAKKLDTKWGLGLVTKTHNDHDTEVWYAKLETTRTIARDILEVINETR